MQQQKNPNFLTDSSDVLKLIINLPETDFDLLVTGLDLPEGGAFPGLSRLTIAFIMSSVWRKYGQLRVKQYS